MDTTNTREQNVFMVGGHRWQVTDDAMASVRSGNYDPNQVHIFLLARVTNLENSFRSVLRIGERLETELLRLAGPECPHDGKRASEHTVCTRLRDGERCLQPAPCRIVGHTPPAIVQRHEPWPEAAHWFRKNR